MAILITATENDFIREFQAIRPGNFSREGLGLLYNYLDNLSDDLGGDIELDVIAICCDYFQYNLEEWWYEWNDPAELEGMDEEEIQDYMLVRAIRATREGGPIVSHNEDFSVIIIDANY